MLNGTLFKIKKRKKYIKIVTSLASDPYHAILSKNRLKGQRKKDLTIQREPQPFFPGNSKKRKKQTELAVFLRDMRAPLLIDKPNNVGNFWTRRTFNYSRN